jgi:hypothetical protein
MSISRTKYIGTQLNLHRTRRYRIAYHRPLSFTISPWDEIMIGNNQFNWTLHDQLVRESASRRMHAVLSVYIHWPGRPLRLPPHLTDIPLYDTNSGNSTSYGDSRLLTALEQFIVACESSKQSVAQWYRQSFKKTQVQARYPGPNAAGFGLYDGSLAYTT